MDHIDLSARPAPPSIRTQLTPDIIISALCATFVLALGALASRVDPDRAFVPLISGEDRRYYVAAIILSFLAAAASAAIRTNEPGLATNQVRLLAPGIVLPAIATGGAGLLFVYTTNWGIILLAAAGVAGLTWLAIWVEGRGTAGQPASLRDDPEPIIHIAVTVATGLLVLSTIYGFRLNMRYTAPLVFLTAGALLAQALGITGSTRRWFPLALAGALMLTELAWVLLYWDIAAWHGGAVLGLGLYTLLAIVGSYLAGGIGGRDLVRQALISAPVLAILILVAR